MEVQRETGPLAVKRTVLALPLVATLFSRFCDCVALLVL
jgi:hypothetical protein